MNKIVCEMCGSNELLKQDGMYVCSSCGTKYTADEAKKLMVTVDNSERLNNLYQVARRARDSDDAENAANYYNMILQEDPNSWEATFYNVYFRAIQTKRAYIESAAKSIMNCLPDVFKLIKEQLDSFDKQKAAIIEIGFRATHILLMLESNARESLASLCKDTYNTDFIFKCEMEYLDRAIAVYAGFLSLGDSIEVFGISEDQDIRGLAITSWKNATQLFADYYLIYDAYNEKREMHEKLYVSKIRKYEPEYVFPAPNFNGFPAVLTNVLAKRLAKSTGTSGASGGSGGCYVATSVYGSYDCPQVWTLRRYRDYYLAKTWYGRAFVRSYYAISPSLVKKFGKDRWFRKFCKSRLDRMVLALRERGYKSSPYKDREWK